MWDHMFTPGSRITAKFASPFPGRGFVRTCAPLKSRLTFLRSFCEKVGSEPLCHLSPSLIDNSLSLESPRDAFITVIKKKMTLRSQVQEVWLPIGFIYRYTLPPNHRKNHWEDQLGFVQIQSSRQPHLFSHSTMEELSINIGKDQPDESSMRIGKYKTQCKKHR